MFLFCNQDEFRGFILAKGGVSPCLKYHSATPLSETHQTSPLKDMTKQMIIAAAFAACSAFAQDAPPPPAPDAPSDAPEMQPPPERRGGPRHRAGGRDRQGPGPERANLQMRRIDPGIMIIGEELVMAKYDSDKDGKLSDEEIAVLQADVKKAQEAKKAAILKKFDKDGDGKLSKEERKAMQEEWLKDHPEAAKRMEEMKARQEARKAEMLKKYDKDGDGKLSDEEKKAMREDWAKDHPEAAKRMEEMKGRQEAHAANMIKKFDKDGDGKLSPEELQAIPPRHGQPGPHHAAPGEAPGLKGPARPEDRKAAGAVKDAVETVTAVPAATVRTVPVPSLTPNRAPIMAAGWILIEEKYDADKDGKLNEAEMAQLNADASKALEARRSARREARKAARGNNDMPPPPAPVQEEGDDE